jgi:hypothetical protein
VSTVLKAAQEIERRGMPSAASRVAMAGADERVSRLWFFVVGGLTLAAGGGFLALQMMDGTAAPPARPAIAAAPAAAPPAAQPPSVPARAVAPVAAVAIAVPPPAQVAMAAPAEAPWGRVDDDSSADPESEPAAKVVVASVPTSAAKRSNAPSRVASRGRAPVEPVGEADDVEPVAKGSGTTGVQVRTIFYAADIAERAVSLRIGGASPVTLHQGESARGVEVQLITRDGVYVRQGGSIFMISGRR